MKYTTLLFMLITFGSYSQNDRYLSFEAGGSGGLGSFNFEKSFYQKNALSFSSRFGLSFTPIDKNNGTAIIFPVMVHGQLGKTGHKLDIGIGQTFTITTRGQMYLKMPTSIGYRFEPLEKNYYLRFAYTPIIAYIFDFQVQHWGGITFGYKLKSKK